MKKEDTTGEEIQIFEDDNINSVSKKKVLYFYEQNHPIHVRLKNRRWLNGKIIKIEIDFFILSEYEDGEVPVFFGEIDHVEKYKTKEKQND